MSRLHLPSKAAAVAIGTVLLLVAVACSTSASEGGDYIPLDECPVTQSTGGAPPGQRYSSGYHHEGEFWVTLPDSGVFELIEPEDGGLPATKLVWWRPLPGEDLTITGRRLDGVSDPLIASVPSGYAGLLQATGVAFPSEGCWEITGKSGANKLTFVALMTLRDR